MNYCDCHSGVKKSVETLEKESVAHGQHIEDLYGQVKRKVSEGSARWLVGLLVMVLLALFGAQAATYQAVSNIGTRVSVVEEKVCTIKEAIK